MSNLFGTLSVALSGLMAEQGALDVTANNVANANTPGYARQRPLLVAGDPVVETPVTYGTGVVLQGVESLRDPILELRLNQETQQQSVLDTTVTAMQQLQVMFSGSDADIGARISDFFNSLNQLSTDPANLAHRQNVLISAGNLASSFRTTANSLQTQRTNLDLNVSEVVDQVNVLTGEIARLNEQITGLENLHESAGTFVDQRTNLIRQLSQLIDVAVVQSDNGITLTTSAGTALVAGNRSFALQAQLDPSGVQHVFALGGDITSKITGGKLAGLISVRDQKIPSLLANLDTLAAGLSNALNTAHQQGIDLNGDPGGNLFSTPPAGPGAAASMAVAITDPDKIAAATVADPSPGNNGNLAGMAAVQSQPLAAGKDPTDFYSSIVFQVGSDISNGLADRDASDLILRQLENQRSAVSGVSLDEEAANLVRYQRAFQAAARVISTISDMTQTVIDMGAY